jgi:hypothetical protein
MELNPILRQCPVCRSELTVTRLDCRSCGTHIEGRFSGGPFGGLSPEQLEFVETFVRCEGKFTRMEGELGLSYPTLRSRLYDIIRVMGYEPGGEEPRVTVADRRRILDKLERGEMEAADAIRQLRGGGCDEQDPAPAPAGDTRAD